VTVAGGATRSPLWMQTHADVSGVPRVQTACSDACSLGSAILAAVGAGMFASVPAACDAMVRVVSTVEPSAEAHAAYRPLYDRYTRLYPAARQLRKADADAATDARWAEDPVPRSVEVIPSILAADFADLGAQVREAVRGGARWLHVDVSDGIFAPGELTFGPPIVRSLRRLGLPVMFDCHLACTQPGLLVDALADAGADRVTFHVESVADAEEGLALLARIKARGMQAGVALRPETELARNAIAWVVLSSPLVDAVDVLLVHPGRGGQAMQEGALDKLRTVRQHFLHIKTVMADGGLGRHSVGRAVGAGATAVIAGTAVFADADLDVAHAFRRLAQAASDALPKEE